MTMVFIGITKMDEKCVKVGGLQGLGTKGDGFVAITPRSPQRVSSERLHIIMCVRACVHICM